MDVLHSEEGKGEEPSGAVSFPASQVKDSSFHPGVATPIKGKEVALSPHSIIKNYTTNILNNV